MQWKQNALCRDIYMPWWDCSINNALAQWGYYLPMHFWDSTATPKLLEELPYDLCLLLFIFMQCSDKQVWAKICIHILRFHRKPTITHIFVNGWTLIPARISNYIHNTVCDEITYLFPNFIDCTLEVKGWKSNFIPYLTGHVITYPCWD